MHGWYFYYGKSSENFWCTAGTKFGALESFSRVPGAVFEGLMQDEQALLFVSVKPGAARVVCHVDSRG